MPENVYKKEMPDLKMQDVGGVDLPYLYYEGEASPILFAHATGFLPWLWHPVIKQLVPQNQIWVPYICNYRECDPEKGGLSWDIIAKDISTFCRSLKVKNPLVVGHSMGSTVLTIAAASYGIEPRGMILIEPIFLPEEFYSMKATVKDHPLASKSIKRTNHWNNEEEAWAYLKSKSLFSDWDEEVLALYLKYGMEKQRAGDLKLTCTPESEAAMFMGGWSRNPWPLLDKLTCPVLVVEGEKSENKNFIDAKKAVSLLRHGKYKSVEGAGHLIPMQKPKEVAQIIKEFLAEII
ncbi:MAG: alpha/beta hydrolase [Smithellaceae bacterium]|jgi:pimeloyl-ACP methyl ester carboxylesterase